MKKIFPVAFIAAFFMLATTQAQAWHITVCVYCDSNGNGTIDDTDLPIEGITVTVQTDGWSRSGVTGAGGCTPFIYLLDLPASYTLSIGYLDYLVINSTYIPSTNTGHFNFETTTDFWFIKADLLLDQSYCRPEGCTPGYWKNHLDAWGPTGYSPGDDFDTVFSVDYFDPDITLEQALRRRGGGVNRLARHGVAALLSAAHPDVSYPLTVADVINLVQGGDADTLEVFNELGCPLGGKATKSTSSKSKGKGKKK